MSTAPVVTAPLRENADKKNTDKKADFKSLSDRELLARFFGGKEDAAFSTLVERHGPLVYGVCRRVLTDANDAEDAFQATFLVLVRKGESLRDPERLGNWLYGVAYRTARKLKAKAAVRTKSERQAGEMPTKSDVSEMTYEELQAILDEEISQLPEKYAMPLVLCYLEGKTNAQAAAQLGWPEGSISRRLSRARELLRSRLAKRGLAMSVALIAAVFARQTSAVVSPELLVATTRAATLAAEGVELEKIVSPSAARVVLDVVASMSTARRFAVPTAIIVASVLVIVALAVWQSEPSAQAAGSLFHFSRGSGVHGLVTTPTAGSAMALPGGAAAGEGSCGAAAAPAATACSATANP